MSVPATAIKAAADVQKVGAVMIHVEISLSLLCSFSVRGSRPGVSIVVVLLDVSVCSHKSINMGRLRIGDCRAKGQDEKVHTLPCEGPAKISWWFQMALLRKSPTS